MSNILRLNNIKSNNNKSSKRVGRGHGSFGGKSGRGSDGQKARESVRTEGGQFPAFLRFNKRGFTSSKAPVYQAVNLKQLVIMIEKNPDLKNFSVDFIKQYHKIPADLKLKIIGFNITPEQETLIASGYTFEANKTTENLNKLHFIKIVDAKNCSKENNK